MKTNLKIVSSVIISTLLLFLMIGIISAEDSISLTKDTLEKLSDNKDKESIPLTVTINSATNWTQYAISLLLSSFFIFFFFGQMISDKLENVSVKLFLKSMKKKTGRPTVFIKHTSSGLFSQSMIDQTTMNKVAQAMNEFNGKDFDLVLHTPGGEVFSALYLSRLFKNYPGKIRTIVPVYGMSGGTLLALSTNEIYMAPSACLGPVDPQLGSLFKSGSARSWNKIVKFKGRRAEDSSISMAMTGSQYTRSIRQHLVDTMDFGLSKKEKQRIADYLTNGDIEHAYALTPDQLIKLGIPVKLMKNNKLIEKLIKIISMTAGEGVTYIK